MTGPLARTALIARVAVGSAWAAAAFIVELGLDDAVAPYPWFIASFIAVLAATILGGVVSGATAAVLSWLLSSVVLPEIVDAARFRPLLDAINVGLAFLLGVAVAPRRADSTEPPARPASLSAVTRALAGLTATGEELATSRSLVQVADSLARGLVATVGASAAAVYLRTGSTGRLTLRARAGDRSVAVAERAEDDDLVARVAQAREPASIDDRTAMPLVVSGETSGVVVIVGRPGGDAGPAGQQLGAVAAMLVSLAAAALDRDRLRAERQASRAAATTARERIASFERLASDLGGAVTVERVGEVLGAHAVTALGAELGLVYAADSRDGTFRLVHARGYPVGLARRDARVAAASEGPVGRVARTREAVRIDSPEAWRAAFPSSSDLPAMTGVASLVALPLGDGEELGGVLVCGWSRGPRPSDEDREALATIAQQGGQALVRARLHEQELEARTMQEAFISVISHELRTPITSIIAGSRLLSRRVRRVSGAVELAADIEAESDRLFRIVEDLLVLSRLERRNLSIASEPVHLAHLVNRVIASEARRWPAMTFAGPDRTDIRIANGEETYIEQILRNLLSNAAKYAPAGSTVQVLLEDDGDDILVRVLDEGPGIARTEVERLFTLFYRSPATAATAAGAGIGLFVSRRLADEMGGRMWARPRPEGGSEFGFSVAAFPIDEADEAGPRRPRDAGAGEADRADGRSNPATEAGTTAERSDAVRSAG